MVFLKLRGALFFKEDHSVTQITTIIIYVPIEIRQNTLIITLKLRIISQNI